MPTAEPECATVIPAPVTAVPPISNVIAALPPLIAPCSTVIILIILPPSGTATKVEPAVDMSVTLPLTK